MGQPVRHALTLAVSRFADAPELPFAPAAAAELASALMALGYVAIQAPAGEPTGAVLGAAVHSALTGPPEDVVIVHVLTHGELIEHTGSLYAVGSDGKHASTEVESWLKAVEDFRDRPLVLFVLDLCHAGTAARLSWQLRTAGGGARAWVLAAAGPAEAAFGGRFTSSAAAVLRRLAEGRLGIDPSVRHVRLGTIVQATRIELTDRRRAAGGFDQTIMATVLDLAEEPDLPFFVNPGYREDPRDRLRDAVDEAVRPFLAEVDPALDPAHFVGRASGRRLGPGDPLLGSFCGRGEQLRNLADWMDGAGVGTGAGLHLVIGSAGTGKSALLGVLVCAAHPVLSEPTRGLWHHVAAVPSVNDALAAIHARQRTLQQIIESLATQLSMAPRVGESWTAPVLISEMRGRRSVPVVVIDAVDEAAAPLEVVNDLLLPLARARRTDGTPACRLVASVRPWPEFDDLVQWARRGRTLVDLDAIPSGELRADLREYVAGLLRSSTVYRRFAYRQTRGAVAAAVAETLAPDALPNGEPRWAPYLLAGIVVQELVDRPEPVTEVETAVRVAQAVPLTVPDLLDRDLSALGDRPWLRPALSALAFAYGDGMPARVVALLAPGFAEVGTDPAGPSGNDIADALDSASFYLRRSVDVDGTTLYRLFHHSLPERLRGWHPDGPGVVMSRLLGWAHPAGLPPRWDASEPYLLRHAIQHAIEADDVDLLLSDPEFLVHADPVTLTPELGRAGDDRARRAAAVYRAARHDGTTRPAVRRRVLAVEAVRQRDPEMARRLRPSSMWEPIWARGTPHPTAGGGRTTPVWAVATTDVDGRPVVSAQVEHGTLSFWEPATGEAAADPLFTESGRVRTLAGTRVDGHPVMVIGSEDGSIRAWDFVNRKWLGPPLRGHTGRVSVLSCLPVNGLPVALTSAGDGVLRCWDLARWEPAAEPLRHHGGRILALGHVMIGDGIVAMTAAGDGGLRGWELETGRLRPVLAAGDGVRVRVLAGTRLEGRPMMVAGRDDGSLQLWDVTWRCAPGPVFRDGHATVHSLICTVAGGQPLAVSGHADGVLRTWDLATGRVVSRLELPHPILALSLSAGHLAAAFGTEVLCLKLANPGTDR